MPNTPTRPGDNQGDLPYVLNWEGNPTIPPKDSNITTWAWERLTQSRPAGEEPQIRLAVFPQDPVRCGAQAVRFELRKGEIANTGNCRIELSATEDRVNFPNEPYEPIGAERWYGFSIYLPVSWVPDQSKEIVTQWHQSSSSGSPPLAILTFDGKWWISERINWGGADDTATFDTYVSDCKLGQWTDWVVHVVWAADGTGKTEIWQDGAIPATFPHKTGKNAYPGQGNYIKLGIYKWTWAWSANHNPPDPSTITKRIMYHDEVRIAGASGSYASVAPRTNLYRYWNGPGSDHFYTTEWNEIGAGSSGWKFERIAAQIHATPVPGTVELLRYWNAGGIDHFYTIDPNEIGNLPSGWVKEKVAGYVYPVQVPGTVELLRYWNASGGDHFYTTDPNEIGSTPSNWKIERTECYVFPA